MQLWGRGRKPRPSAAGVAGEAGEEGDEDGFADTDEGDDDFFDADTASLASIDTQVG